MMKAYSEMSREEMKQELASLKEQYKKFQELDLSLDMSLTCLWE